MKQDEQNIDQLNELVISVIRVLHRPNIEGKFKLVKLLRRFAQSSNVNVHHRFKANVAINLLVDDIQADLDIIKQELITAA